MIPEGGEIPKGYGVAWRNNYGMRVSCYPIPINIIVKASLDIYYWIIHGCWHSKWEATLLNIRQEEQCKFIEDYENRLAFLKSKIEMRIAIDQGEEVGGKLEKIK